MSNPESFIEEVTEEVRRDRLFGLMKRYGWIAIVLVVAVVGWASWNEWQKAQAQASAQGFGDAVIAALGEADAEARTTALAGVVADDENQALIKSLIVAANASAADNAEGAAGTWADLAARADVPEVYQQLALLKSILAGGSGDADTDTRALERLATPGAPFRAMALEQQALALLGGGDSEGAITRLREAVEAPSATDILRRRALQLIVALGGSADPA